MNYFDKTILLIIISIFPSIIYLFYIAYFKNTRLEERSISSSISIITTYYLIIKYNTYIIEESIIFMFIPIIFSYDKKKYVEAIILSIISIMINPSIKILIILLLYPLISIIKKQHIKYILYTIISFLYLDNFNEYTILLLITFISILLINNIILDIVHDFIKYHKDYNELLKEESITTSLFKITHEIKNPLAVCIGYLHMLENADLEKYQRYTKIISSEIDRALIILSDFSNLNKIQINPNIMDANLLIEDVIDKLDILAKEKKIVIDMDLIDDELYINGDYNRLNQVLINIIKNSIEAITNKGIINIKTIKNNNDIIITIEDNGSGIKESILNRISEPFFTTKKNGTGLGVALSKEIIKKHLGTISYSSKENIGTKVTITLPSI